MTYVPCTCHPNCEPQLGRDNEGTAFLTHVVQFGGHALEELIDDHASSAADHSLPQTGDGAAGTNIAHVTKQRAGFVRGELNCTLTLNEPGFPRAVDAHLILRGRLQTVKLNRAVEDAADRTHTEAHLQVVSAFAGLFQFLATRKALSDPIRVCEKTPYCVGWHSTEFELAFDFHYTARSMAAFTARRA